MDINELSYQINGAVFELNRELGAGFLEKEIGTNNEVCSLPVNVEITDEEVDDVIAVVRRVYEKQK